MRRKLALLLLVSGAILITVALASFYIFRRNVVNAEVKTPYSQLPAPVLLAGELNKAGISLETAPEISGDSLTASISGFRVFFKNSDLATQVRTLQLVLPRLKMEGKNFTEIDLRFNKVVVR